MAYMRSAIACVLVVLVLVACGEGGPSGIQSTGKGGPSGIESTGKGGPIGIASATYGGTCPGARQVAKGNRTAQVAAACNGKTRCDYVVDSRDGDPFPECPKDFAVTWRCGTDPSARNTTHPAVASEGYTLTLTCE